ncbi:MAG: C_GCAxxG_C_C family protein [Sedimentisphaerales bacterium]|nr:C_GCAxxG_C_C family protein [Sedimentisphaerales bacterium]
MDEKQNRRAFLKNTVAAGAGFAAGYSFLSDCAALDGKKDKPEQPAGRRSQMSKAEKAVKCFEDGYNCSQAVFSTYSPDLGVPSEQAIKIASGFGGGMHIGSTCGAVIGALMVLGLKFAKGKDKPYDKTLKFVDTFCRKNKSTDCQTLLGCDVRTKEGRDKATKEGLFRSICSPLVRDAAEILEDMLKDDSTN